jgi:hypothetical protein
MAAIAGTPAQVPATRRQRAARVVDTALRGGVLGAVVAAVAWLIAGALAGTAFVLLVLATIAVGAWVVLRGSVPTPVWLGLTIAWGIILLERAIVQENGGLWVGAATWLGVILGARRAGIAKWALPLLAYPALCGAIAIAAGQPLDDPWGTSWLWVPAVLGPVIGARTLLNPSPRD